MDERQLEAGALLRWSRACLLSLTVLVVSTLAHTSAGGVLPPIWALVGLSAAMTLMLAALLGRPVSRRGVVALLAGGQAALHLSMTALSGHVSKPVAAHGHVHHHDHAHALTSTESTTGMAGSWLSHLQEDLSGPNLAMAVAHLLAGAALGWWLSSGEQALWALIVLMATCPALLLLTARVAAGLRALTARIDVARLTRRFCQWPEHVRLVGRVLLACAVVRRGPPRWLGA